MREPNTALYMLRCAQLGLTIEIMDLITIGDVYDMYTEKANDYYDYPIKATQEDIDRFF